jgi:type IV pilus assembly protein PilO
MNFIEELRSLDTNDPARWPPLFRGIAVGLVFLAVVVGGIYMFVVKSDRPLLERAQREEQDLRATFEQKQRRAANFDAYKAQLAEIERSFGAMLRQLPGRTEVPNLLVDISQTGLAAGLEEQLFQPLGEVQKEFYAELPIKIRLTGGYHQIGEFVSGIAALPRIVTLHDISIKPVKDGSYDQLVLDVTARTYRYLDEEAAGG